MPKLDPFPTVPLAALLALLALLALPTSATAQESLFDRGVEVTPMVGYHFGSSFETVDFELGRVDFEIEDDVGFGAVVDIDLTRSFQLELLALRQESELLLDEGFRAPRRTLGNVELDYLHVGAVWHGTLGQVQPFGVFSIGATRLDADGVGSESYPSVGLGGGVKILFNDRFGARFEGRFFATELDDDDCCRRGRRSREGDDLVQGFFGAGLLFRF